ncbi:hypothetical protein TIFTF001_003322 [Ficus carica]|uniref:RING-type domain-containing protein n=1 Tax=Ficus carica TaxID=3494 RepID=A0AA87ZYZ0_FICCA|nr:hypothetical protein TIFTF001_003322 [Ficus carica]
MTSFKTFFLCFSFFFVLVFRASADITTCGKASCMPGGSPVHFPFRLRNRQNSSSCAYAARTGRFDLSCNNRSQTLIRLGSGDFTVERIDYKEQSIWINDPDDCLPRRFLNQEFANLTGETFQIANLQNYTFLNCSADMTMSFFTPIRCLGGGKDYEVIAVPTAVWETSYGSSVLPTSESASPAPAPSPASGCSVIGIVPVPLSRSFYWPSLISDLSADIQLTWRDPNCGACVQRGGECGYRSGSATEIGCSVSLNGSGTGLPRSAKYGIIIGVGIPGFICIIGLASYICGRVRACGRRHRPYSDYTRSNMPEPVVVLMGLDGPTIDSFPKIELGESKRLPKPSDNTCPICLSEYQPKETLRTIPECNHYFHASCVDEWLKMNATCPLCRNSPDGSSHVSPSTSASTSSSSLLSP